MPTIATRAFCAMLSTIAAIGLVTFANPANAVGGIRASKCPSARILASAAPMAPRG